MPPLPQPASFQPCLPPLDAKGCLMKGSGFLANNASTTLGRAADAYFAVKITQKVLQVWSFLLYLLSRDHLRVGQGRLQRKLIIADRPLTVPILQCVNLQIRTTKYLKAYESMLLWRRLTGGVLQSLGSHQRLPEALGHILCIAGKDGARTVVCGIERVFYWHHIHFRPRLVAPLASPGTAPNCPEPKRITGLSMQESD